MSSGERNQYAVKSIFERLLKEARTKNLWLYQRAHKQWFTPDEFEQVAEHIAGANPRADDISMRFEVQDPRLGVKARIKNLKKEIEEADRFSDKVFDYYHPRKR
jgi:hypothetical protein